MTSSPTNSLPTNNAISSPASAAGATPCDSRVLPIIEKFGLEAVLASLSPRQAKDLGLLTTAISGRSGTTSSRSAALQQFLESKLAQQNFGSIECMLTWKHKTLPSGRQICRLLASEQSISDTEHFLLPTPSAVNYGTNQGGAAGRTGKVRPSLQTMARKGLWPTPRASASASASASANENRQMRITPSQMDGTHGLSLAAMANLWPTPTASRRSGLQSHGRNAILGVLNPQWVAWLMGYPINWLSPLYEPTATPSSRKSRRSLSKRP